MLEPRACPLSEDVPHTNHFIVYYKRKPLYFLKLTTSVFLSTNVASYNDDYDYDNFNSIANNFTAEARSYFSKMG